MTLPLIIFFVFTTLATGGAYWAGSVLGTKRLGFGLASGVFLFMIGIYAFLALWVWPMMKDLPQ